MQGDKEISKFDDVIDTRDIEARIEHLEETEERDEEEQAELDSLLKLRDDVQLRTSEYEHGEALIADMHFQAYAQELAEDCGMIPGGLDWPLRCIDWEQAARELQMDYSTVEFQGLTFWVRS